MKRIINLTYPEKLIKIQPMVFEKIVYESEHVTFQFQ